jgi:hypothetical protein
MKKLLFDISVESPALLAANPKEFYKTALLANRSTTNFRTLVNVKEKIKLASLDFADPIQEAGCTFSSTGSTLDAKEMEPCKLAIGTELCQYTLEQSFVADWMKAGSSGAEWQAADFMSWYYMRLAEKVSDRLEVITWQGDSAGDTGTSLDLCDGLEKKLAFADIPAAQRIAGTTIDDTNVIAQMTLVYEQIPTVLRSRAKDIAFYVSTNVAASYRLAVAKASAEMYTNKNPELNFIDLNLIIADGMSNDTMVLSLKDNFVFLTDLLSDENSVNTIDMKQTTGDRKLRTISDFKFGVDYLNESEFVVYNIAKQS